MFVLGYHYRWIRPADYIHQAPDLIARCTPIQRQLLGELGTGKSNYMGDSANVHPISRHWRPEPDDIPLQGWAEAQMNQ